MSEATAHSYRTFLVIWFGQTISILGTGLTNFGVSVWVFLETGSLGSLAILALAALLPRALLAPFAGVFVDRWNRRTAMIVSDAGSGLATMALAVLFVSGNATVVSLGVVVAFSSAFGALQWPAYQATTTMLVPKEQYSRAQGLVQLSDAAGTLIPPALAAGLLAVGSISTLIAIDIVTFLFAVGTLLMVRVPTAPSSVAGGEAKDETVLQGAAFGFTYIQQRPGWGGLLGLQFAWNILFGFVTLLLTGYVLTVSNEQVLGLITSAGSAGFLAGAIVMTAWKGATTRRVLLILVAVAGAGLSIVLLGFSSALLAATVFLFAAALIAAIQNSTYRALWQAKVEPDVQGRVFSARMMIVLLGAPVAYLLIGPLMNNVFIPMANTDSIFSSLFLTLFGSGDAAPYRAFFSVAGVAVIVAALAGWAYGPLRHLERDIPDFTTP
jgi:hypothetical protein